MSPRTLVLCIQEDFIFNNPAQVIKNMPGGHFDKGLKDQILMAVDAAAKKLGPSFDRPAAQAENTAISQAKNDLRDIKARLGLLGISVAEIAEMSTNIDHFINGTNGYSIVFKNDPSAFASMDNFTKTLILRPPFYG